MSPKPREKSKAQLDRALIDFLREKISAAEYKYIRQQIAENERMYQEACSAGFVGYPRVTG